MFRTVVGFGCACACLGVVACGSEPSTSGAPTATPTATDVTHSGMSNAGGGTGGDGNGATPTDDTVPLPDPGAGGASSSTGGETSNGGEIGAAGGGDAAAGGEVATAGAASGGEANGGEGGTTPVAEEPNWPGTLSDFHGFELYEFNLDNLNCKVAVPKAAAAGRPWIWRARFWDHQSGPEVLLLGEGYHVAYVDVSNLFGSDEAIARFDTFYQFLTESQRLSRGVVLEGMSRGGLMVYNWAARNPDKVHCIYADAPVGDFKSWPGGLYEGDGNAGAWSSCLNAYGLTEQQALSYGGNPIDNLQPLAAAGIPLLHVVGDSDVVVPVAENTAIIESRYKTLGGSIEVIHKPGVGHVHGLADPTPIVDFIRRNSSPSGL